MDVHDLFLHIVKDGNHIQCSASLTRAKYKMLNQAHTIRFTARATGSHMEGVFPNPGGPSVIHNIKVSAIASTSQNGRHI